MLAPADDTLWDCLAFRPPNPRRLSPSPKHDSIPKGCHLSTRLSCAATRSPTLASETGLLPARWGAGWRQREQRLAPSNQPAIGSGVPGVLHCTVTFNFRRRYNNFSRRVCIRFGHGIQFEPWHAGTQGADGEDYRADSVHAPFFRKSSTPSLSALLRSRPAASQPANDGKGASWVALATPS